MKQIFKNSTLLIAVTLLITIIAVAQQPLQPLSKDKLQNKTFGRFLFPDCKEGWIEFRNDAPYTAKEIFTQQPELLGLKNTDEMRLLKTKTDAAGNIHHRFAQFYQGIRVEMIEQIVHEKKGKVYLMNGDFVPALNVDVQPAVSTQQAINEALKLFPAQKYLWEIADEEARFKLKKNDPEATLYPQPELLIVKKDAHGEKTASNYVLAYRMAIFAQVPVIHKYVYIDAHNGTVIRTRDLDLFCSPATVNTTFNGQQTMNTTFMTDVSDYTGVEHTAYFSKDDCNPDTEINSWYTDNFSGDYLKYDTDNDWQGTGSTKMVATTLWSVKKAYNYYNNVRGHESFDGSDGLIDAYSNVLFEKDNGEEYCHNANYTNIIDNLNFGSGGDCTSGTTDDFNTLDIVGHEYTHGVIEYAHFDALDYSDESGALNESFADIFGEIVENYVEGNHDWLHAGDQSDGANRSFLNPNDEDQPDTYLGDLWATGSDDYGGVHTNSGVQNFVFFLLADGGSGTNDLGWDYSVTGIGFEDASDIAWQAMMQYLDGDDGYLTARNAWIQSAKDLFGSCSQQVISVGEAWLAVGVTHYTPYNLGSVCGTYSSLFATTIDGAEEIRNAPVLLNNFLSPCTATITTIAGVTLRSGNIIQLFPGFTASSGCVFTALIDECEMSDYDPNDLRIEDEANDANSSFPTQSLISIYPNPVNDIATIEFKVNEEIPVTISILDVEGRIRHSVFNEELLSGDHYKIQLSSTDFPSGLYVCVMKTGEEVITKKFLVQH